jgi:hypothetical protein
LEAAQQNALSIILNNIDKRISTLGVSDYVARKQKIGNDRFIAVEIG